MFYYIIPIRKEVTIKNLKIAFPNLSEKEVLDLAYKNYKSIAITLVEILTIPLLTEESIKKIVFCDNIELLKDTVAENKGVILMTGHYGNWEYSAIGMGVLSSVGISIIVQKQRNDYVDEFINNGRKRFGNKTVPLGVSIRNIYQELLNKNVVALIADQKGPENGVKINFFNTEVTAISGFATLAIKTKVPIIIGFGVRHEDNTYHLHLEKLSVDNLPEGLAEQERELTQRHAVVLEKYIRMAPEQWFWMHNRWKYYDPR